MGICLSCEAGEAPRASELGLPRNFTVFKELGAGGEGRTYLVRERLGNGRWGGRGPRVGCFSGLTKKCV